MFAKTLNKDLAEGKKINNVIIWENSSYDSIIVIKKNGEIMYANEKGVQLINFLRPSSGENNNLLKCLFSSEEKNYLDIRKQILNGQSLYTKQVLQMDDQERVFLHHIEPLKEEGKISAIAIVSNGISKLNQNRKNGETTSIITRNDFFANINHELRTPLIGIISSVELLDQSNFDFDQKDNIDTIKRCSEQLLKIVNELNDIYKLELGTVTLEPEPCNLADVFDKTINSISPMLKIKKIALKLDIDRAIPEQVLVDKVKLQQILINILKNTIQFSQQGEIYFTANVETNSQKQSRLTASIAAASTDIPPEQIKKILSPFIQVHNSVSHEIKEPDLELYICQKLLEVMGGEMWVNMVPNAGIVFNFKIPLELLSNQQITDGYKAEMYDDHQDKSVLEFYRPQILIVEDNKTTRKILAQMLKKYGFDIDTAPNGLECLKILQEKSFDLILMDMQMPVMDGYQATRTIKQNKELAQIPVIAITANTMSGEREKCLTAGCSSYIAKPFKAEDLVGEIRTHLKKKFAAQASLAASDSDISEPTPAFINTLAEMLDKLNYALQKHNTKMARSISHDIKDTAEMYGFKKISELAASIEYAAANSSHAQTAALTEQLHSLLRYLDIQVS